MAKTPAKTTGHGRRTEAWKNPVIRNRKKMYSRDASADAITSRPMKYTIIRSLVCLARLRRSRVAQEHPQRGEADQARGHEALAVACAGPRQGHDRRYGQRDVRAPVGQPVVPPLMSAIGSRGDEAGAGDALIPSGTAVTPLPLPGP